MLFDCHRFDITGTQPDRLADDDIFGDTASSSVSFATAASSRWLTVTSNAARRGHFLLTGNAVAAILLDFAFHAHHVRNEHDMPDIHKDTLFVQRRDRLVDDRISRCFDTEYLGDLTDVVGAGPCGVHTHDIKYVFQVGAFSIKYILPGLFPDDDPEDVVDALDDDVSYVLGQLEQVLVTLPVLRGKDNGCLCLVDIVLEIPVVPAVVDLLWCASIISAGEILRFSQTLVLR